MNEMNVNEINEKAYKVRITVQYDAIVFVRDGEKIEEAISDITIPENGQCKYVLFYKTPNDTPKHVPDYDHLNANQKAEIRKTAIEIFAAGDGGFHDPGRAAGQEKFEKATIKECLESIGDRSDIFDFDLDTGEYKKVQ